jgi:GTP cyclohydrolase II
MTNNPRKLMTLGDIGISINERVPVNDEHNSYKNQHSSTKKNKIGHFLNI